jgi:hypothetical protein
MAFHISPLMRLYGIGYDLRQVTTVRRRLRDRHPIVVKMTVNGLEPPAFSLRNKSPVIPHAHDAQLRILSLIACHSHPSGKSCRSVPGAKRVEIQSASESDSLKRRIDALIQAGQDL